MNTPEETQKKQRWHRFAHGSPADVFFTSKDVIEPTTHEAAHAAGQAPVVIYFDNEKVRAEFMEAMRSACLQMTVRVPTQDEETTWMNQPRFSADESKYPA